MWGSVFRVWALQILWGSVFSGPGVLWSGCDRCPNLLTVCAPRFDLKYLGVCDLGMRSLGALRALVPKFDCVLWGFEFRVRGSETLWWSTFLGFSLMLQGIWVCALGLWNHWASLFSCFESEVFGSLWAGYEVSGSFDGLCCKCRVCGIRRFVLGIWNLWNLILPMPQRLSWRRY